MSTSASQPAADPVRPERKARTRLEPIGGNGKSVYVMLVCLGLSVIGAVASRAYSKGGTAYITCNVPGAFMHVDSNLAVADASGSAVFAGLPFGVRTLEIQHAEYRPLTASVGMGWLSSNRFSFQLTPIPLKLTIYTMPGAEVFLNNQSSGTADNRGVLVKDSVLPGDYEIQVKLSGYAEFRQRRRLRPPVETLYASLNITPERLREVQEQQRQAQENAVKVQQLIGTARQQFGSRQYNVALGTIDEALRLDPNNSTAQQMKDQIVQTMKILK